MTTACWIALGGLFAAVLVGAVGALVADRIHYGCWYWRQK